MFIDIQKIPPEGKEFEFELKAADLVPPKAEAPDFRFTGLARVEGRVDRAKDQAYRLRGKLRARLAVACSRCLEEFEFKIDEPLDLLYLPASENVGPEDGDDRRLEEEDLEVSFYRDDQIVLNDLVCEQTYLSLPMKPLCKTSCKGLCPTCGTNLNLASCGCVRSDVDPRLLSLKALLKS